jgi:hypothetical protein
VAGLLALAARAPQFGIDLSLFNAAGATP